MLHFDFFRNFFLFLIPFLYDRNVTDMSLKLLIFLGVELGHPDVFPVDQFDVFIDRLQIFIVVVAIEASSERKCFFGHGLVLKLDERCVFSVSVFSECDGILSSENIIEVVT